MGLKWDADITVYYDENDIINEENIDCVCGYFWREYDTDINKKEAENILRFVMHEFIQKDRFTMYIESSEISKIEYLEPDCFYNLFEDYMEKQKYEIENLSEDEKQSYKDGGEYIVLDHYDNQSLIINFKLSDRPNPESVFSIQNLVNLI